MKILIIEDEKDLQELMLRFLKREGYHCETAMTYKEGIKKTMNYEYDCLVVDLNLPDGDGLKIIRHFREDNTTSGVVVISARDSVEDRISGLDIGADDYLTKPFSLPELNARIKAVVRRKTGVFEKALVLGDISIKPDDRTVEIKGEKITLTKKEYDILLYLARNKNRIITKDSIAEYLWGDYMDNAVSFDFIYAHVKNLRKKLKDKNCGDYIRTVYGIGYKFLTP